MLLARHSLGLLIKMDSSEFYGLTLVLLGRLIHVQLHASFNANKMPLKLIKYFVGDALLYIFLNLKGTYFP